MANWSHRGRDGTAMGGRGQRSRPTFDQLVLKVTVPRYPSPRGALCTAGPGPTGLNLAPGRFLVCRSSHLPEWVANWLSHPPWPFPTPDRPSLANWSHTAGRPGPRPIRGP